MAHLADGICRLDELTHRLRHGGASYPETLVPAALIGICLHAEVVAYVARYASQQEISKLITIVSPVSFGIGTFVRLPKLFVT